ncbi:hypothetical protein EDB84DRAFT_1441923 [Lactarius hengduanensis]|nr:hypothetical protein EDB84DRAFT_1441923 [Lactarius hengduanensis]
MAHVTWLIDRVWAAWRQNNFLPLGWVEPAVAFSAGLPKPWGGGWASRFMARGAAARPAPDATAMPATALQYTLHTSATKLPPSGSSIGKSLRARKRANTYDVWCWLMKMIGCWGRSVWLLRLGAREREVEREVAERGGACTPPIHVKMGFVTCQGHPAVSLFLLFNSREEGQWGIQSGHYPTPNTIGLTLPPINSALPPRKVAEIPSRFRPPGAAISETQQHAVPTGAGVDDEKDRDGSGNEDDHDGAGAGDGNCDEGGGGEGDGDDIISYLVLSILGLAKQFTVKMCTNP